jgi:hypothetical protein
MDVSQLHRLQAVIARWAISNAGSGLSCTAVDGILTGNSNSRLKAGPLCMARAVPLYSKMKLYHWQITVQKSDNRGDEITFNFLTVAEDADAARRAFDGQVKATYLSADAQAVIRAGLNGNPTFVAEPGYPIVIW